MTAQSSVRLVLHPGAPKCGSSSIQRLMYTNVDELERRGVYLPNRRFQFSTHADDYRRHLGNPVPAIVELTENDAFDVAERRLVEARDAIADRGGDTVVISAENLGNDRGIAERRALHEAFARTFDRVQVLYYMRRQDDWLVSAWQQWGHQVGDNLQASIERHISNRHPQFLEAADFFEEVYGPVVQVVPLDRGVLREGDLLADFTHRAGLGPLESATEEDRVRNAGLSSSLCEVLSRIPQIYDTSERPSIRALLARSDAAASLAFSSEKRMLSHQQRRSILEHFEAQNRELHARYFPHVEFDAVFGLEGDPESEVQRLRAEVEGLRDVLAVQTALLLELAQEAEQAQAHPGLARRALRKLRGGTD